MDGFCDTRSFFGCRNIDECALIARHTVPDKARESDSAGFVLRAAIRRNCRIRLKRSSAALDGVCVNITETLRQQ